MYIYLDSPEGASWQPVLKDTLLGSQNRKEPRRVLFYMHPWHDTYVLAWRQREGWHRRKNSKSSCLSLVSNEIRSLGSV